MVVSAGELSAANTWAVADIMGEGAPAEPGHHVDGCWRCGMTPARVYKATRVDPFSALLELDGPRVGDPLLRSRLRCKDREMCEARAKLGGRS